MYENEMNDVTEVAVDEAVASTTTKKGLFTGKNLFKGVLLTGVGYLIYKGYKKRKAKKEAAEQNSATESTEQE